MAKTDTQVPDLAADIGRVAAAGDRPFPKHRSEWNLRLKGDLDAFLTSPSEGWEKTTYGPSPSYTRGRYRVTVRRRDDVEDEWYSILVYDLEGPALQLVTFFPWGSNIDKLPSFLGLYDDRLPRFRDAKELVTASALDQMAYAKWLLAESNKSMLAGDGSRCALYSHAAFDLLHGNASIKLEVCLDNLNR